MDWSKSKTVFIIVFILLNIILGYNLYTNRQIDEYLVSEDLINSSLELLKDKGITVVTEIPRRIEAVASLTVDYETTSLEELNENFFQNQGRLVELDEKSSQISRGTEKLICEEGKKLIYKADLLEDGSSPSYQSLEKAEIMAKDFLKDRGIEVLDMKLTYSDLEERGQRLVFSKLYNDIYVEDSYTEFIISPAGVISMERVWLRVVKEGENPIFTDSTAKALLELVGREEAYNRQVVDINLCYYFNLEDSEFGEGLDAIKGRAMPTWRIQLDDGQKIIVDNI